MSNALIFVSAIGGGLILTTMVYFCFYKPKKNKEKFKSSTLGSPSAIDDIIDVISDVISDID